MTRRVGPHANFPRAKGILRGGKGGICQREGNEVVEKEHSESFVGVNLEEFLVQSNVGIRKEEERWLTGKLFGYVELLACRDV